MKSLLSLSFNNIALIHNAIDKTSLSSLYFQRALIENKKLSDTVLSLIDEDTKKSKKKSSDTNVNHLTTRLENRRYEILFNTGLSLLLNKQPVAAFECLYKATNAFGQNARLWLRIAECCIMCYRHSIEANNLEDETNLDSTSTASHNEKIFKLSEKIKCIQKSFGTGFHHKIQFSTSLSTEPLTTSHLLSNLRNESNDTKALPKLVTLEFAYMCLRNSLKLLPSNNELVILDSKDALENTSDFELENSSTDLTEQINDAINASNGSTEVTGSSGDNTKPKSVTPLLFDCVWPSKPIGLSELQSLRSSILTSLSYVSLCLKDYTFTMKYCNSLLATNDFLNRKFPLSKSNKYK